jgi:hypothetical protein
MLLARVGKRMCGFAISSGTNCERSLGPETGYAGSLNPPGLPRRGNVVSVMGYSLASMWSLAMARLWWFECYCQSRDHAEFASV